MFLSPYALLQASKPKPPKSITTQYDLFSLTQNNPNMDTPPEAKAPESAPPMPSPSFKRTHYIREIHTRHISANRCTRQHPGSL